MATAWQSNRGAVEALLLRAVDAGLTAAAHEYAAEVTRRLKDGYTSGDFVTGTVAGSVTVGPLETRGGRRMISVGTSHLYALYWELGHLNLWMADYAHVPVWVPTFEEMAPQLGAAYLEAAQRVLRGAPTPASQFAAD